MTSAGMVLSDGPGSFTGLRVGAAVAKALVQARGLPLWIAPSLHGARPRASPGRRRDRCSRWPTRLRGELYAAAYRFDARAASARELRARRSAGRRTCGRRASSRTFWSVRLPDPLGELLERWVGTPAHRSAGRIAACARVLLDLVGRRAARAGSTRSRAWEPEYGRPAEAQARWETAHGRPLPDSVGSPG